MSTPSSAARSLSVDRLGFAWPDGRPLLVEAGADFIPGLNGLIGVNGSGKSTLLRLLRGELPTGSGHVDAPGSIGYLPQDLTLDPTSRVDDVLGIAGLRRILRRIEAGRAEPDDLDQVADSWDVEERATAELARFGFEALELDRPIATLSGGETVLLALAALFLAGHRVLLLDEPTNNLDADARQRLYTSLTGWSGVAVVVSHDRELLRRCDRIVELRDHGLRTYGGNFEDYTEALAAEQQAAERMVRSAESDLRRQRREQIEAQTKIDRRQRYGKKAFAEKRMPRAKMKELKRSAQVSAAKLRDGHADDVEQARQRVSEAEARVRSDDTIRVDLTVAAPPSGREVLGTEALVLRNGVRADVDVRGPERIALTGPNGCGKTTLLQTLTGDLEPRSGTAQIRVPYRVLSQRLDLLSGEQTVLAAVGALAPSADSATLRGRLARFLLGADLVQRPVSALSGGERFRATLAALLLAEPPPQLLILDEPTNNLDLASLAQLTSALQSYPGALVVTSHDPVFLAEIGIGTRWRFEESGSCFVTEPG